MKLTEEQMQKLIDCIDVRLMDLLITERRLMMNGNYDDSRAIRLFREELETVKKILEDRDNNTKKEETL